MRNLEWVSSNEPTSHKILFASVFLALIVEATLVMSLGQHPFGFLSSSRITQPNEDHFIEAQVIEFPDEPHLVEKKQAPSAPEIRKETTLSKSEKKGAEHSSQTLTDEHNQTQAAPESPPSHGPIAFYAPAPVIPSYLQDKELSTSVVIDFYVDSKGHASPHLVGSSGNEELDAIALAAVQKWQFRPAEENHQPIDAKVRLRIVFEVQ